MKKEDCFYLGTITKKYSFKGAVTAKVDTDNPEQFKNLESVFLDINQELIPFFIEKINFIPPSSFRFKFEEIDTERDAQKLIGTDLFLSDEYLPEMEEEEFFYHQIVGYLASDANSGEIGEITEINTATAQALFTIQKGLSTVLIPLHEDFIQKIDHENKTILFNCPEGLLDLYLE